MEVKWNKDGVTIDVFCKCGSMMFLTPEGFWCYFRTKWNFLRHDRTTSFKSAWKRRPQ